MGVHLMRVVCIFHSEYCILRGQSYAPSQKFRDGDDVSAKDTSMTKLDNELTDSK